MRAGSDTLPAARSVLVRRVLDGAKGADSNPVHPARKLLDHARGSTWSGSAVRIIRRDRRPSDEADRAEGPLLHGERSGPARRAAPHREHGRVADRSGSALLPLREDQAVTYFLSDRGGFASA